jgi:hypothetical protein
MTSTEPPFDWRAFWADLLQGTGRALLMLDGSHAAQAAMTGLDYFDAARRRRRESEDKGSEDSPEAARRAAGEMHATPAVDHRELDVGRYGQYGPRPASPDLSSSVALMTLGLRPGPLSGNPYDLLDLPAQVNFASGQRPVIVRR